MEELIQPDAEPRACGRFGKDAVYTRPDGSSTPGQDILHFILIGFFGQERAQMQQLKTTQSIRAAACRDMVLHQGCRFPSTASAPRPVKAEERPI